MNECTNCDCYDPDIGCTMPSIDRQYACPIFSNIDIEEGKKELLEELADE